MHPKSNPKSNTRRKWHTALGLIAIGGLAVLTPAIVEARGTKARQQLTATGVDPDARGRVKVEIRDRSAGLEGRFEVRARKLDALSTFDVTLDGVRIGSFTTRRNGSGKARFDTRPRGDDQLLGVDPRGRTAAVVDGLGAVVLQTAISSSSIDPNDVRCCLPDDSGPECEDRTAAECAAAGGVDMGPGSCLPNPCSVSQPPPGGDIVCCIPDDSGPECEDRTAAECSAQGGVNLGPGSCTPNPCVPGATIPPGATTTTTLPGGGGTGIARVRCERRADRSKVSVDGNTLRSGTYSARIVSGANTAASGARSTVGDEVEFDFDSEPDEIAAGATPIGAGFIQGSPPQVTGEILDAGGAVVAQATVTCELN
jgi:hypothetical protein